MEPSVAFAVIADLASDDDVDWLVLAMGLGGGLALFLIGMSQVTDSLKAAAGDRLRTLLATLSSNRLAGAATGATTTAVIQSSSVTTVLVVGFVSADLLSLSQAAAVILGANLGTTVTAQVIALDVTDYALGLLALGSLASVLLAGDRARHVARAAVGLGLLFFGLNVMSDAMAPLGAYEPFLDLLAGASNPLVAVLVGAGFTALVQSSSATTGIVVVMAGTGLIDLPTGIAIVLGAKIGTCATALLAAIGKPREAVRVAVFHVLVNVLGALGWILVVDRLADAVVRFSGSASVARQIANAYTVLNVVNLAIFLVLLGPLVAVARWLVPDRPEPEVADAEAAFLDPDVRGTPVLALELVRRETLRQGLLTRDLLRLAIPRAISGIDLELDEVEGLDDQVDRLHEAIVAELGALGQGPLDDEQRRELMGLLEVTNELEHLSDFLSTNVVGTGRRRLERGVEVSPGTVALLEELNASVLDTLDEALGALGDRDVGAAKRVTASKRDFQVLEQAANAHLAQRLAAPEPQRVDAYSVEVELVEALRRTHQGCRRIARAVANSSGRRPDPTGPAR